MAAMVTWDNVRFALLYQNYTDTNGFIWVPFTPEFPSVCHGLAVSLDDSGGVRPWLLGIQTVFPSGFHAGIADQNNNPVTGTFLGIHYIAFGE